MAPESVKEYYNRQYSFHEERRLACPNALHDLSKAQRRVDGVLRGFRIELSAGAAVLDVGSGLGYYTKALASTGADVTGIDFSEAAIEAARRRFPDLRFEQATWPDDIAKDEKYDLIWMVNFSLLNTFDVAFIERQLVDEAVQRLRPRGHLVVGWNSNLSGIAVGGYSNWPMTMLRHMKRSCGLSSPLVTESRTLWASGLMIRVAYLMRRSVPLFMIRRNE
jgi:SAM-dependent methyltransferase